MRAYLIHNYVEMMQGYLPTPLLSPSEKDCKVCKKSKVAQPRPPQAYEDINWVFLFLAGFLCNLRFSHLQTYIYQVEGEDVFAVNDKKLLVSKVYLSLLRQLEQVPGP